jgi:dienelactone hydrolase
MRSVFIALLLTAAALAQTAPAPRDLDITAPDGARLRATYYPAAATSGKSAPAVLLLHMCNTDRKSWTPVAQQLSAAGIHAFTIDNRGFGESAGPRNDPTNPEINRQLNEKWPGDFDAAYAWLVSQTGVDKTRIGLGGGSCGVNNAVQLASRHPEVRSLALLAGPTTANGLKFLTDNPWLPVFTSAAADDQFDAHAPENMQWLAEVSGNPRNKFVGFKDGKHGTEIFGPHPELPSQIVAWYIDTLVKSPADPKAPVRLKKTPAYEFWALASSAATVPKAIQYFHQARSKDPHAFVYPEVPVNLLGYTYIQAKQNDAAIALLKLNTEVFPKSANTYDSLADAYLAAGQNGAALAAEQKCLELLPEDPVNEQFKAQLRQAAEEKIKKLKPASND